MSPNHTAPTPRRHEWVRQSAKPLRTAPGRYDFTTQLPVHHILPLMVVRNREPAGRHL